MEKLELEPRRDPSAPLHGLFRALPLQLDLMTELLLELTLAELLQEHTELGVPQEKPQMKSEIRVLPKQ